MRVLSWNEDLQNKKNIRKICEKQIKDYIK